LKAYARGKTDAFKRECGRDEFTKRVCRAAAKCAIAGGFTLWSGVQTGQPAWQAEIAAFNACWAAILTEFVP
jgi:drug/metabolite transporter superfamily protein YnfA